MSFLHILYKLRLVLSIVNNKKLNTNKMEV